MRVPGRISALLVPLMFLSTLPLLEGYSEPTATDCAIDIPAPRAGDAPIVIDNDTDMKDTASALGWSGNGSVSNPFIIEDLTIDGTQEGACIYIGNTTLDLIVRNCTLDNAVARSSYRPGGGIVLWGVDGGLVVNCSFTDDLFGAYIMVSSGPVLMDNRFDNLQSNVQIFNSNGVVLCGNELKGSSEGVAVHSSSGVDISKNTIFHTLDKAIGIYGSGGCNISSNLLHNNSGELYVYQSQRNEVFGNTLKDSLLGIKVSNSAYNNVSRNELIDVDTAVYTVSARHNRIFRNDIVGGQEGLYLYYSDFNQIYGNTLFDCTRGMYIVASQDNNIQWNVLMDDDVGIELYSSSDRNRVEENTIFGDVANTTYGIFARDIDGGKIVLWNNSVNYCRTGMRIESSIEADLFNNRLNGNGLAIELISLRTVNLTRNTVRNSDVGLYARIDPSITKAGLLMRDNMFSMNGLGASIDMVSRSPSDQRWVVLEDNYFDRNAYALNLSHGYGETVSGNRFIDNDVGITIVDGKEDWIYDNYLRNDLNANISLSEGLKWNITKTRATNVIYGPYIGGNFWSDYNGSDLDGDGIGDEFLPWGPGDHLPLVRDVLAPVIADQTHGEALTGEMFFIEIAVSDLPGPLDVDIECTFWFGDIEGNTFGVTTPIITMGHKDPLFNKEVLVAVNAATVHYSVRAIDRGGNDAFLHGWRNVTDVIPPTVEVAIIGPVSNGQYVNISVTARDNIGLSEIGIDYEFNAFNDKEYREADGGSTELTTYFEVLILQGAKWMEVESFAYDLSMNKGSNSWFTLNISDVILPVISNVSFKERPEDLTVDISVEASDNIDIMSMSVDITVFPDLRHTVRLEPNGGIFIGSYRYPLLAKDLFCEVKAFDEAGNEGTWNGTFMLTGSDTTVIADISEGAPMTGREYAISVWLHDELDPSSMFIEYSFDGRRAHNVTGATSFSIPTVPADARIMHVRIGASDAFGNWAFASSDREVVDIIPPTVGSTVVSALASSPVTIIPFANDNWEIGSIGISYRFFNGAWTNLTCEVDADAELPLNEHAPSVEIIVRASDTTGNMNETYRYLEIMDDVGPVIEGLTLVQGSSLEDGDLVIIRLNGSDNRGLDGADVLIALEDGTTYNISMGPEDEGSFLLTYPLDGYEGAFSATPFLHDLAGNTVAGRTETIEIEGPVDERTDLAPYIIAAIIIFLILAACIVWFMMKGRRGVLPEE